MDNASRRQCIVEYLLWVIGGGVFCGLLLILLSREHWGVGNLNWSWINCGIGIAFFYSVFYFAFLLCSAVLAPRWKKPELESCPACTVIVPAYNEGQHVLLALESLLAVDFPREKLQIIAVNDGSKDDTLQWIKRAACGNEAVITVIDLPENKGKKHALYTGMKLARHEFIVTVDSDSVIRKDALKKLLYPFADPSVGAVAGTLVKKVDSRNFHTRMCDVMLVFGCSLLRRSQSCCGNVFCTPGALSAYRRSAVLPLLDEWLEQTFMGVPSRIGEDRAIATLLLGRDWQIVYQEDAVAETCLPEKYTGVVRMLLRWTRSDFRENLMMPGKVFRKMDWKSRRSWNCLFHWVLLSVNMLSVLWLFPAVVLFLSEPASLIYKLAMLTAVNLIWSLFPALIYWYKVKSLRQMIWAVIFGFYSQIALSWVGIYALLTMRDSRWLTRELR